jgi:hypothetical protein
MENTKQNNKLVQVTSTIQTNQDTQRTIQWGRKTRLIRKTRIWQPKENPVMGIA